MNAQRKSIQRTPQFSSKRKHNPPTTQNKALAEAFAEHEAQHRTKLHITPNNPYKQDRHPLLISLVM